MFSRKQINHQIKNLTSKDDKSCHKRRHGKHRKHTSTKKSKATSSNKLNVALLIHTKELTAVLDKKKAQLREKYHDWVGKIKEVPHSFSTDDDFIVEHIKKADYTEEFDQFLDMCYPDYRKALDTNKGLIRSTHIWHKRLFEFVRNLLAKTNRLRDSSESSDSASESDDEESEGESDTSSLHIDSEEDKIDADGEEESSASERPVAKTTPASNTNRREKRKRTDQPPENTSPKKRKITPAAKTSEFVVLVDDESASSFTSGITDYNEMTVVASDLAFRSTKPPKCSAQDITGLTNVSGSVYKGLLLLSPQRPQLMASALDSAFFWSVSAPYLDSNTRLYATLIDLSCKFSVVISPTICNELFMIFFLLLVSYCLATPKTEQMFWKAMKSLGIHKKQPKSKLLPILVKSQDKLKQNGATVIKELSSLHSLNSSPTFKLSTLVSERIEATQRSQNGIDEVLLHIAMNLLGPDSHKNYQYEPTLDLFKAVFFNDSNKISSKPVYNKELAAIKKLIK